jgi:hyaluronan synthase
MQPPGAALDTDGRSRDRQPVLSGRRAPGCLRRVSTFIRDGWSALHGSAGATPFMVFFAYVWLLWAAKVLTARRYRPSTAGPSALRATVIVPVYREPEAVFRRCLGSVRDASPAELIAVVDGGDPELADIAAEYCDQVLRVPKHGKRAAIAAGNRVSDPGTDVVVVVDSDTVWTPGTLAEMLRPLSAARLGGGTPRQAIFDAGAAPSRRLADWLEDLRYHVTVPAQSVFGQIGCLAGRTIAYRRRAFDPAVDRLVAQTVFGVPQHVGDDRVLTNELLRSGWRTVYQSTALVLTDAPDRWWTFWRQQLRWARSSQRETVLCLRWLWRRPVAFGCFAADIVTPFALYAVLLAAVARGLHGDGRPGGWSPAVELPIGYAGMVASIGLRQLAHFRRVPRDLARLPLFVLQLTFVMVPIRIVAFATMLHQGWATRPAATPRHAGHEAPCPQSAHV